MNNLVRIGIGVFVVIILSSMFSECGRRNHSSASRAQSQQLPSAAETEVILREKAEGLDLKAVTELAKKSKDAEDFEKRLNSQSEAVNNIDLNDDGKTDYIKVTEYGSGKRRGFSLTTELAPGEVQEIATIEFEKEQEKTTVQTAGNPSLYGPGSYHHSSFGLGDALLLGWLFSNRGGSYQSPYGYGHYPPSYGGGWSTRDRSEYSTNMSGRTSGTSWRSSSQPVLSKDVVSPNAEKTAAKAKALTTPTQSQRSFGSGSSRPPSSSAGSSSPSRSSNSGSGSSASRPSGSSSSSASPSRSGGFGRSSSSGSSRSGSSFGGGK